MRATKSFLRSAFDAIIEARAREAARTVAYYQSYSNLDADEPAKR